MASLLVVFAAAECGGADGRTEQARLLGRKERWDYAPAMRKVARKFRGVQGVVLHLGDSITYASPYTAWARAGKGKTKEDEAVLRWSHCGEENDKDGWYLAHHDLPQGRSYTAAGGITADQYLAGGFKGMPSLGQIIKEYNPQVAIVMLGTNDAWQGRPVGDYTGDMERIVSRLLANGTVVILSTIPPLIGNLKLAEQYNAALWKLAERHKLPVIDYYGEIVARRPGMTWDGTLLVKSDGHPSADREGVTSASEPTPENLKESGYLLRGWLSVRKLAEVKRRVFERPLG
jgi:lysophospholipase L1-like esterase